MVADTVRFENEMIRSNTPVQAVFNISDGEPVGVIWRLDNGESISFSGLGRLITLVNEMATEASFGNEPVLPPKYKGQFFLIVRVLFRQHNSMQGELRIGRCGGKMNRKMFKSALELIKDICDFTKADLKETSDGDREVSV